MTGYCITCRKSYETVAEFVEHDTTHALVPVDQYEWDLLLRRIAPYEES